MQTLAEPTAIQQYLPWIAFLTMGFLIYKVFYQKDKTFVEKLTTRKIAYPIAILGLLMLAPAGVMAIFGVAEAWMTLVLQVMIAVLFPVVFFAGILYTLMFFGYEIA